MAAVASVLTATAAPSREGDVQVRRPSDILVARIAAKGAFVALFLGLGGVALLIAGVGVANIMVISVRERRGEIGLRRALGARRRHVAVQFLLESTLLAVAGGIVGIVLGVLATLVAARVAGTPVVVPPAALLDGVGGGLSGGTAGRLSPAEALRSL